MGAVITSIDGRSVRNPDQLADIVATADEPQMVLTLVQDGRQSNVTVKMEDEPFDTPSLAPIQPGAAQDGDATRLDGIERRLHQLEDRLEKIERMLEKRT